MDKDTLENIENHIFTLDAALLEEYREDGYDADHLQPGMRVWLDGDIFRTAEEIEEEAEQMENSVRRFCWADEAGQRERIEEMREAVRLLRAGIS